MNTTRSGKIARLPREVRQQLNHRLTEGEPHTVLVAWLNALPSVQAILKKHFEGYPIRAQNLSQWKQGGYRDWLLQQEAHEIAHRLGEDLTDWRHQPSPGPDLTDSLSHWLATRLAAMTRQIGEASDEQSTKLLHEFGRQLIALRRSEQQAARLKLEAMRVELDRRRLELLVQADEEEEEEEEKYVSPENVTHWTSREFTDSVRSLLWGMDDGREVCDSFWIMGRRPRPVKEILADQRAYLDVVRQAKVTAKAAARAEREAKAKTKAAKLAARRLAAAKATSAKVMAKAAARKAAAMKAPTPTATPSSPRPTPSDQTHP